MLSRGDLADGEWAVLEPLLPVSNNRCGRWRDHRQVINGIIHRMGTGVQWRELPERGEPSDPAQESCSGAAPEAFALRLLPRQHEESLPGSDH
ncbi:transposase [Streptomyces gardneri]|uniref:transposase n=1 Tax=Streptomyces gardneri TaxID=66892 RepID=UPI0037D6EA05